MTHDSGFYLSEETYRFLRSSMPETLRLFRPTFFLFIPFSLTTLKKVR